MDPREPVVRPEYGPSLLQLLGPRTRGLPRAAQAALALAAAGVVLLLAWMLLGGGSAGQPTAVVRKPVAFNLVYSPVARRVAPEGREVLRLVSRPGSRAPFAFAVASLDLPAYRGDVSAQLMFMSVALIDRMRATIPGFVWRGDGRVNVNRQPGYEIVYQARIGGRTTYGKRVLLVPGDDPSPRQGLDITMRAARSGAVPGAGAVGLNGGLKTSYRSLRFGTERP